MLTGKYLIAPLLPLAVAMLGTACGRASETPTHTPPADPSLTPTYTPSASPHAETPIPTATYSPIPAPPAPTSTPYSDSYANDPRVLGRVRQDPPANSNTPGRSVKGSTTFSSSMNGPRTIRRPQFRSARSGWLLPEMPYRPFTSLSSFQ